MLLRRGWRRIPCRGVRHGLRRKWERQSLLPGVLLDFLKRCDVLGHLILLGGKLTLVGSKLAEIAPDDGDIERNEFYLLRHFRQDIGVGGCLRIRLGQHPGDRGNPRSGKLLCLLAVSLPAKRQANADQNRYDKATKRPEYPFADRPLGDRWPAPYERIARSRETLIVQVAFVIQIANVEIAMVARCQRRRRHRYHLSRLLQQKGQTGLDRRVTATGCLERKV